MELVETLKARTALGVREQFHECHSSLLVRVGGPKSGGSATAHSDEFNGGGETRMARFWKEPYTLDRALALGIRDSENAPVVGVPNQA